MRTQAGGRADEGDEHPSRDRGAGAGRRSCCSLMLLEEQLDPGALAASQGRRLAALLAQIDGRNAFYTRKLREAGVRMGGLRLQRSGAAADDEGRARCRPGAGAALGDVVAEPIEHYTRYCQTSSTTGRPLRWIDTNESWQWVLDCWKAVYRAARVLQGMGLSSRFRSDPFSASGRASRRGRNGDALRPWRRTVAQLGLPMMRVWVPPSYFVTPTYAMHLAEVAAQRGGSGPSQMGACACYRGRRAGWQHPSHARADRTELGRPRDRSSRSHRGGPDELRVLGGAGFSSCQRGGVPLRGARPGRGRAGQRRGIRGARGHESWAHRLPSSSAIARGTSSFADRRRPVRTHLGAPRRRHRSEGR